MYGVSKLPQRPKVISPAGTSFQEKGRLQRLVEELQAECHPPSDAPRSLASSCHRWP